MVDSQEINQTYGHNTQPMDDNDAVLLSQIPTNDLMDLEGEMFHFDQLDVDVLKLESLPSMNQIMEPQQQQYPIQQATPITEMLLEHMDKTPTLDEHHDPMFNFNVDLNGENSGKSSWMYSSRLKKVFVKMGQPCTFNLSYQSLDYQELYVRAMLVCSTADDMHQPVYRCDNHRISDNSNPDLPEDVKAHVMRCFNPTARYIGSKTGVAFKDRLAVLLPLGSTNQDQASLNISLEFVCQNSCRIINRRATAIIFTLEDAHKRILGKKSLHLKVCSCPKRDKQKEEANLTPPKRKSDLQLEAPPGKKVAKTVRPVGHTGPLRISPLPANKLACIKKEVSPESPSQRGRSLTPMSSQELVDHTAVMVNVPMPSIEMAVKLSEYAFDLVAGNLVRCVDDTDRKHLAAYLTQIRRLQSKYETYL